MIQPSRRALLATLAATPLALSLSACGGREAPDGVLRVALGGGPDSLDPLRAEFAVSALLFRQIYAPVVSYGLDGAPAPALATLWTSNDDHTVWTFAIREGLTWSDGSPLTADDILQSLRHGADPATAYPDASELYQITGYKDAVVNGAPPDAIGVRTPTPTSLEITLEAPDAAFPARLQEFYPVPLRLVRSNPMGWTDPSTIVVSGPYKPVERTQTRLVFDANPLGGWVEGMPRRIEVEAVDDAATRLRMFQSGDLDLAQDPPALRARELAAEFGPQYQRVNAPRIIYMSMNTRRPALADRDVRRALAMGFDRTIIADNVMRGSVEAAGRWVRGEPQPAYDPDSARALLAAKGHTPENPLRFELLVTKDDRERAAIQMVDMWKRIGVEATLFAADSSAVVARLNAFDFDAAIVRLDKGLKSDPLDLMASYGAGGTAYSHQWSDPGFDAALDAARAEAEPALRREKLLAAEKFLLDDAPITPIWFFPSAWLVAPRVSGGVQGVPPILWPTLRLDQPAQDG